MLRRAVAYHFVDKSSYQSPESSLRDQLSQAIRLGPAVA